MGHPAKSKQTDTSIRGVAPAPCHRGCYLEAFKHFEVLLNGRTGYLRSWSREQFKWQEGKQSSKNSVSSSLSGKCLPGQAGLLKISNPRSKAVPGDGEMAAHPLQGIGQMGALKAAPGQSYGLLKADQGTSSSNSASLSH